MDTLYTIAKVALLYLLYRTLSMFWSCGGPNYKLLSLDTGIPDCKTCKEDNQSITKEK